MDNDVAQIIATIDSLKLGYTTLAGLVGTPLAFWTVSVALAVIAYSYLAAGGTWSWSYQRTSTAFVIIALGFIVGALTAQAAVRHYHLDQVVSSFAARKAEACRRFEQAVAEGKVIALSRDVVDDILRPGCDYTTLLVASEQPGSRLRFVRLSEPGPRGMTEYHNIGVPR